MTARPDTTSHPLLQASPYQAYVYGYPHKTAYRQFEEPAALADVWRNEQRDALFLYVHVPYCEMRCGFCNLFTTVDRQSPDFSAYLDTLERETQAVAQALGDVAFARAAIGGGTPTILQLDELERLFDLLSRDLGADLGLIPTSIETSPATATQDKLAFLRERGVQRVSIGVQSFHEEDAARIGRPMRRHELLPALQRLRDLDFPCVNLDLIYGGEGQSVERWLDSVKEALDYDPEELFLYPLYVRPLTTLGRRDRHWDDQRLEAYRRARDFLIDAGYRQVSMRMFEKQGTPDSAAPDYCCQQDSMLGLGCGARSYTRSLHYSTEYAVGRGGIREIISDYLQRPDATFTSAHYGVRLDHNEQLRRDCMMSLFQCDGLDRQRFRRRFEIDAMEALPQLDDLVSLQWMDVSDERLRLTPAGIERSDAIGPWLYSPRMQNRMGDYEWR